MIATNTKQLHEFELMAMQRMPATIDHEGKQLIKTLKYDRHSSLLPMAKYTDGTTDAWVSIVGKILEVSNAT